MWKKCLGLVLAILAGGPMASPGLADTRPTSTRRTFLQPRIDPRRLPLGRENRLTEFQPIKDFVPKPLNAPPARQESFFRLSGRGAQIDRRGVDNFTGGFRTDPLRFENNRILFERRTGFRPRR